MRGNRRSDTIPELLLRKELWRRGLRYRLCCPDLPGRPDIVFRAKRVAIFCDGDFWHGRDWPQRSEKLATGKNADYWIPKIEANMLRDRRNARLLTEAGWEVLRYWEHDLADYLPLIADAVEAAVRSRPCFSGAGL